MFDELLGRAELKDRIAALEAELDELRAETERLEERAETADRERREAIRKRQEVQEERNRLEDRIAQLEGELDRQSSDETEVSYRATDQVRGRATETVLDRLTSYEAPPEGVFTAAVDTAAGPAVMDAFGDQAALVGRAAPCVAITDDRRILRVALSPPVMPESFSEWGEQPRLRRSWFLPTGEFTLALVRSDLFAMGTHRGSERVDYHGFSSDVMGEHSKGGFSQARYERRRDEQIEAHLKECRNILADRTTDRLYLVGEQTALDALEVTADVTDTVDATGAPEAALEEAFREFWTTQLYLL